MGLQLDFSKLAGKKVDQLDSEGVNPGRGMALVVGFDEYGGKSSEHILKLEIVAWSVTDANGKQPDVGKQHIHRIFTDTSKGDWQAQNLMAQLAQIAMATGMITPDQADRMIKTGNSPDLDFTAHCSKVIPVFVELAKEERKAEEGKESKSYVNIAKRGLAIYHIGDPRAKGWPFNQGVLNNHAAKANAYRPLGSTGSSTATAAADPLGADPLSAIN